MEEKDASEGVEVTHPTYGRGFVSSYDPRFGEEPDQVTVEFYEGDDRTLPVYAVELAADVTSAGVTSHMTGFQVTIDDGHSTIQVHPDGSGGAYEVMLSIKGEEVDSVLLQSLNP